MNRTAFLRALSAAPLATALPATAALHASDLPAVLRGGRLFAIPKTPDGREFRCWLDTDGSGFVFDDVVRKYHLPTDGKSAHLPAFRAASSIPAPSRDGGVLTIHVRSADERAEPILQDFEAQLGGSWFADRIWHLDFRKGALALLGSPLRAAQATAPLTMKKIYPRVELEIAGKGMPASFDIAASVAEGSAVSSVRATSFVKNETFAQWLDANPTWATRGIGRGILGITVPVVRLGSSQFSNVEFTTRPDDDVFEGDDVTVKLGANAYAGRVVTLDYTTARLRVA